MLASMHVTDLKNEYYAWLCEMIGVDQLDKTYWKLTDALMNKEFNWSVPNDDNRGFEGKNLREKFCEELDIDYDFDVFDGPANMLEVIVALAYRCTDMVDHDDKPMFYFFWILLDNAKLTDYHDDVWTKVDADLIVDEILNRIIDRTYYKNGCGGLFPMKHNKKDQRKVELWYQMSLYLVENYY